MSHSRTSWLGILTYEAWLEEATQYSRHDLAHPSIPTKLKSLSQACATTKEVAS